MKDSYTKKEVANITGLPYRNVQFYTEQGVVVPEVEQARGRGKFRRYSNRDLVAFIIAGELAFYGMTVSDIKNAVSVMRAFWGMKVLTNEKESVVPDSDALKIFSQFDFSLLISRNKDKSRITQLRIGTDRKSEAVVKLSMLIDVNGKTIVHLSNKQANTNIAMDQDRKVIKNLDPDQVIISEMVSFIFIGLSELLKESIARIS